MTIVIPTGDAPPRWMRELDRLAAYKTQIYISGNVKDTLLYPTRTPDDGEIIWPLTSLKEALFNYFRYQASGYDIVASYNMIDGMSFADAQDTGEMSKRYEEIAYSTKSALAERAHGRFPQPSNPEDPMNQALQQIRSCLVNRVHPCVFVIEHVAQMLTTPTSLGLSERQSFLRLLKSASESQPVNVVLGETRHKVQNLLILTCDNLRELPAWLYLNNPFCGNIEIEAPRIYERKQFFNLYLDGSKNHRGPVDTAGFDKAELVDLTEGMRFRDLIGIKQLAQSADVSRLKNAKSLIDCYKYGEKESEWDNLAWERLADAEAVLSRRVIGQPAAIAAAADILRRARLHLSGAQHSSKSKPRGVLFFAGPTGVGKTELAKAIADLVFSSEDACIRFDMSEYSQSHADQRLLGAPPGYVGYEEGGQLTNRIKANPFSVLLFDEIDKAHPNILDKFLQILEDGRMTDGRGETVYFSESIIIFTSNAGIYELNPQNGSPLAHPDTGRPRLIVDPEIDVEYPAVKSKITKGVQSYFKESLLRPELLNRIGQNIIVFDFVRAATMQRILAEKIIPSIQKEIKEHWKLNIHVEDVVVDQLVSIAGIDVELGGRGIGNLAETALLNPLSRVIFQKMADNESIDNALLTVSEVIPPGVQNDYRYEIEWELHRDA